MAASGLASLPIDAWTDGAEKSAMQTMNLTCDYLAANVGWVEAGANTGALGAIGGGSNVNYQIYTGCVAADLWDIMWKVPLNLDRTKPIYAQVVYTGSATGSATSSYIVTYNPLATGDDADIAPATALDETIPLLQVTLGDVDELDETYVGKINGDALDSDEEFVMWRCELSAVSAGTDWGFAGVKIYYEKALA